jgi:uncharacterized protein (TIGR02246 family)
VLFLFELNRLGAHFYAEFHEKAGETAMTREGQSDEKLAELFAKEEIRDAVTRSLRGVDRCDAALIASAFHADGQEERLGETRTGAQVIADALVQALRQSMQSTSHNLTTQTIAIRGDWAGAETYSAGQHIMKDGRRLNTQARYVDRFEKRGGAWLISHRLAISEISEFVETKRAEQANAARRDSTDPSYAVLFAG